MLSREPRKLSHFIAREMLYDFAQNRLDDERNKAVKNYLQTSAELRQELKTIFEAEKYTEHLALTEISPVHLEELNSIRTLRSIVADRLRWKNWPELFKWTAEALLVSTVVAIAAILVPWDKVNFKFPEQSTSVRVQNNQKQQEPSPPPAVSLPTKTPTPLVQDEEENLAPTPSHQKIIPLGGMLYRVMMTVTNSDDVAQELKRKIIEDGGTKAGQVELGWRKKNPNGNYFHFAYPEAKYEQFIRTLGSYGQVRIYKNPHERVMPEGQIRMILWIEDKTPDEHGADEQHQ